MKFIYKDLKALDLIAALKKLANYGGFKSIRVTKDIGKIVSKWDREQKEAQELFVKLLKKFAELDEKGNVKPNLEANAPFIIPEEKADEFQKQMDEFDLIEFQIVASPIPLVMLEGVGLTPIDLEALTKLIAPDEEALLKEPPQLSVVN